MDRGQTSSPVITGAVFSVRIIIVATGETPQPDLGDFDVDIDIEYESFIPSPAHGRVPDAAFLARLQTPDFLVVVFESTPACIEVAVLIAERSAAFATDTVLICDGSVSPPALPIPPRSLRAFLMPQYPDHMNEWPAVLSATLGSAFRTGLVCVDWEDLRVVFEDHSIVRWAHLEAADTRSAMALIPWHLARMLKDVWPAAALLVLSDDRSYGMRDINCVTNSVRALLSDEALFHFATPKSSGTGVTVLVAMPGCRVLAG